MATSLQTYFQTYVGELSEYLIAAIKEAEISDNVYVEHGPQTVEDAPDDFCIVTYPLTLRDKGPYQTHDVRFELVHKDLKNGRADLYGVEAMANKLLALFPIRTANGRHTLTKPYIRLKGADGLGHTSWTIQCDCLVNTTDKYIATDDGTTATT